MIVPFYVEMPFNNETQSRAEDIAKFVIEKLHLAVYQGEPIFGEDLMELEARLEKK